MLRVIPILILAAAISVFSLDVFGDRTASDIGTEIGRYAPPVVLNDLSGNAVSLETLRGRVVLLNFWSAACSPCKAEMPSMNRLSEAFKDRGLQVVSVAIDASGEPVRDYVLRNNIGVTMLLDRKRAVYLDRYSAPVLPAAYLIDRSGVIVEKFSGLQVWDAPEMKGRIQQLLQTQ